MKYEYNLAPIVLFVYNRPWHTQQTVEALQKNDLANESELIIYADAPKNEQAIESVSQVREYIRGIGGFKKITIIERDRNWGLADSIIDGVTSVINKYGKIIVLEDDLVTNCFFLRFMNEGLEKYLDRKKVVQISGYAHCSVQHLVQSSFFLDFPSSWGWATWKRAWNIFSPEIKPEDIVFLDSKKEKLKFNLDGQYNYYDMLIRQSRGKLDSWAIRWYLSIYKYKGLILYPSDTLVNNTGMDGSGTHCKKQLTDMADARQTLRVISFPEDIKIAAERTIILNALPSNKRRWINVIGTLLRRVFC